MRSKGKWKKEDLRKNIEKEKMKKRQLREMWSPPKKKIKTRKWWREKIKRDNKIKREGRFKGKDRKKKRKKPDNLEKCEAKKR